MIIINKSGYLKYKDFKFKCALGKSGIGKKRKEGDNITPKGTFKIVKIYYRNDRIKKIYSKIKAFKINNKMGWCDDSNSKEYNRLIKLPSKYSHEKLYRKDNVYDLVIVLNYNMSPVVKSKGSGIFIHVAKKNYKKTAGCITLKKHHLLRLIKEIKNKTKIIID